MIKIFYGMLLLFLFMLGIVQYLLLVIFVDVFVCSKVSVVMVLLCREVSINKVGQDFWQFVQLLNVKILFNIVGCYSVKEVVIMVYMVWEVFNISWIKFEVIGEEDMLQLDIFGLVDVVCILIEDGFQVFFYIIEDLVVVDKLVSFGCEVLMFWGVFIGFGMGFNNVFGLCVLCVYFLEIFFVIDVGLGLLSQVVQVMEFGMDVILLNIVVVKVGNFV